VAMVSRNGSIDGGDSGRKITGCPVSIGLTTTAIINTIIIAAKMTIISRFSIRQPLLIKYG
jgi:hypothetical protein